MAGRNIVATNIDHSKPTRSVPVTGKGRCSSCKEENVIKLNVKGNVGVTVIGSVYGHCVAKKCTTKPLVELKFRVRIN